MIMLKRILPYILLAIGAWIIYSLIFTRLYIIQAPIVLYLQGTN